MPIEPLPYAQRLRNRIIALGIFAALCFMIGSCIFGGDKKEEVAKLPEAPEAPIAATDSGALDLETEMAEGDDSLAAVPGGLENNAATNALENGTAQGQLQGGQRQEDLANTQATVTAAVTPENPPEIEVIDSTHIKAQKNVFLAEKIDNMLRRFKPMYGVILVVDVQTNEIIAWGERKDEKVQSTPDFFVKNTFPAASLAKTITIAAAMDSKRYSLNTPIPMIGAHHTLYKNQLRVKENYTGPTIELQDAYAKSANPPLALIGLNLGAGKLKDAAKKLGYNLNFPSGIPG